MSLTSPPLRQFKPEYYRIHYPADIRDASEDDQQCADSFGESVDDQQCADNRRKADENEQSTDGLSHVVDDQQAEYIRRRPSVRR